MGNRDTEEMLEAARAECVRLERIIAHTVEWVEENRPIRCALVWDGNEDNAGTILRLLRGNQ